MNTIRKLSGGLCISCMVFLLSCSQQAGSSSSNRIKTLATNINGVTGTASYTYDAQSRLVKVQSSLGTLNYSFSPGFVTETDNFLGGADTVIYTLNSSGLAISDNNQGSYTYDANGYTLAETSGVSDSIFYTNSNGNRITATERQYGQSTVTTYSYLTTPNTRNHGLIWGGKDNTNLINTRVVDDGYTTTTYTHTYVIDNLGRVTKDTETGTGQTTILQYTYY